MFFAGAQVPMGVPDPYAQPPAAPPTAAPGKPSCIQHEVSVFFIACHMPTIFMRPAKRGRITVLHCPSVRTLCRK